MNTIRSISIKDADEARWNKLLMNSYHASYRSSLSFVYSRISKRTSKESFLFQKDNIDIAGVHYLLKKPKFGSFTIADLNSGIIFLNEPEIDLFDFIVEHFFLWAKEKGAAYLRINLWLPELINGNRLKLIDNLKSRLADLDFTSLNGGRHTYFIDIDGPEEDILARMEKQTRKRIRQGIRSELFVKEITEFSDESFELFWGLYSSLALHKNFIAAPKQLLRSEMHSLMKQNLASLFFTYFQEHLVYVSLTSTFGDSATLYSAINSNYSKIEGCPTPGQLSYWEVIRSLKRKKLGVYDLGFCPGAIPDPNHSAYGIWKFKYDLGGVHVQFTPTFGKALRPISGRLFQFWKYKK